MNPITRKSVPQLGTQSSFRPRDRFLKIRHNCMAVFAVVCCCCLFVVAVVWIGEGLCLFEWVYLGDCRFLCRKRIHWVHLNARYIPLQVEPAPLVRSPSPEPIDSYSVSSAPKRPRENGQEAEPEAEPAPKRGFGFEMKLSSNLVSSAFPRFVSWFTTRAKDHVFLS